MCGFETVHLRLARVVVEKVVEAEVVACLESGEGDDVGDAFGGGDLEVAVF